jgi:hypothetical protein
MALAVPGFVVAVALSLFFHMRRNGLDPSWMRRWQVPHAGVPAPPDRLGIRQGLRSFARALVLEAGFLIILLFESFTADESTDYQELFASRLFGVTLAPAIYAAVFLLLFAAVPTLRWISRDALRHPWSIASLALLAGGFVLDAAGAPLVLSGGAVVAGGLIGSITGLYVQDLGPQPWLGLLFLAFMYASSWHDGNSFNAPSSLFGWLLVVLLTAYVVREIQRHWQGAIASPVSGT